MLPIPCTEAQVKAARAWVELEEVVDEEEQMKDMYGDTGGSNVGEVR